MSIRKKIYEEDKPMKKKTGGLLVAERDDFNFSEEILKEFFENYKCKELNEADEKLADIDNLKKRQIESIVSEILMKNQIENTPTIDITALVKKDGFTVNTEEMDINTTGMLFADNDRKIITVNTVFRNPDKEDDVIFKKSRFITAHEYGHFILHKKQLGTPIYAHRDTYTRTSPLELEADYFARSILMPLDKFKDFYSFAKQIVGDDEKFLLKLLSKTFGATTKKVKLRIEDIKQLI